MFTDIEIKWLQAFGLPIADALRAYRPGGIQERLFYTSKCLKCGAIQRRSLKDLANSDWRCACGGLVDPTKMIAATPYAQAGDMAAWQRVGGFELLSEDSNESSDER
jgi:hypothetical protein